MPVKPIHLLAGAGLKAATPKRISYGAFAADNVVVDIDSLIGLVQPKILHGNIDCSIHGYLKQSRQPVPAPSSQWDVAQKS